MSMLAGWIDRQMLVKWYLQKPHEIEVLSRGLRTFIDHAHTHTHC